MAPKFTDRNRSVTMNINHSDTKISATDPLKHIFRKIFETLPTGARGHVVAVIGELIGTIFFIFFAFAGGQVANASSNRDQGENVSTATELKSPQQLLYVALSAGFSLAGQSQIFIDMRITQERQALTS